MIATHDDNIFKSFTLKVNSALWVAEFLPTVAILHLIILLFCFTMIQCPDACTGKPCYNEAIPTCENEGTDCRCIGHLEFDAAGNCVGKHMLEFQSLSRKQLQTMYLIRLLG